MRSGGVLVTGAAGFLGRHLVDELLRCGADVVGVVRPGGSAPPDEWASRVELMERDLADGGLRQEDLEGVGTVYHLAARYLPGNSEAVLDELREANVKPAARLIDACLQAGVWRLVHLSSVAACDSSNADTGAAPVTAYGRSKREAEEILGVVPPSKLAWTILRPTAIFGEHGRGTMSEIARAVQRKRFAVFGDGTQPVNFSYAGNVAAAILHCESLPVTYGKTYVIADGSVPLAELDRMIRHILGLGGVSPHLPAWAAFGVGVLLDAVSMVTGRRMPLSVARVRAAMSRLDYSDTRFREETGFKPPTPMLEALEKSIAWYREQGIVA
jgi:nucleoside-diphosphate-sugar epimerase